MPRQKFIEDLLKSNENRRIEFKESLPAGNKLERTAVAFSNDAGGTIYLGIKNQPREITGVAEENLFKFEELISNIIYENCYPAILADIVIQKIDQKYILIISIPKGSLPPYHVKSLGKEKGTFIRVGSSNRAADREIIEELERKKRNIAYDSTLLYDIDSKQLNLDSFQKIYQEKTNKKLNQSSYIKLGLFKQENKKVYPTIASVLLSDVPQKRVYFPYAKIECARFKGLKTDTTIDAQSIDGSICLQPEAAMAFIERNVKKGSRIGRVYREERWEYPMLAVREIIINAVIHRDYSLSGKDIKVAIFDDMLEITSPGSILPSIDIKNLTSGQSEIRNKTLAPIFKELRLIEQWGTGFQKLSTELKKYPEIEFKLNEPGLAFQVQFVKKDYTDGSVNKAASTTQVPRKYHASTTQVELLKFCSKARTRTEIQIKLQIKNRKHIQSQILKPLLEQNLLRLTIPEKPNSPLQKYITTDEGLALLQN